MQYSYTLLPNKSTECFLSNVALQNGIIQTVVTSCSVLAPPSEWLMNSQKLIQMNIFKAITDSHFILFLIFEPLLQELIEKKDDWLNF